MALRTVKIVTAAGVALWASLITLGNLIDYPTNFEFVRHVMSMDTTFPDNGLMGRSMTASWIHHVAYWIIIAVEAAVAFFCWWGSIELFRSRRSNRVPARAKNLVATGYLLAIALWFVGFIVIGGEWFAMWQSAIWNGINAAFRVVTVVTLFLIVLYLPDEDVAD